LIINAAVAFLLLFLCSQKGNAAIAAGIENERTTNEDQAARLDGNESALQLADF
jgi:hypothetical protein